MHFNGALGTKLLTAEATDASVALDPCFSVFDHDGLGGTDVAANTATHTHALFYYGLGTQDALGYAAEQALEGIFAVARKAERAALHYSLKIRNHQRGQITVKGHVLHLFGEQSAPRGGGQGGNFFRCEAEKVGGHHVQGVGRRRGNETADLFRRACGGAVALHADDGIRNGQDGVEIFVKVEEHIRKVLVAREAVMVFGLDDAGNGAEHIFGGAGHAHHAVAF